MNIEDKKKAIIGWVHILVLMLLCILLYLNSLSNGFVWDDEFVITNNEALRSFSPGDYAARGNPQGLRPITTFSLALDYHIWGLKPFGYHLANLVYFVISVILLFYLVNNLFKNRRLALISGILFAAHPLHTEAVSALLGRSDLLVTIFFLLAFHLYIRAEVSSWIIKAALLIGALISYALSVLSKETGIMLPFLLLTYDIFRFRKDDKPSSGGKWLFYLPLLLLGSTYFFLFRFKDNIGGLFATENYWGGSLQNTLLMMLGVFKKYILLLIFPSSLSAWYVEPVPSSPFEANIISGGIFLLIVIAAAVLSYRRWPEISFSIAWFLVTLIPLSNIIPILGSMMAERWLYLPSVGFSLLSALILEKAFKHGITPSRRTALYLLISAILITYSVATISRNRVWKDNFILFSETVKTSPKGDVIHNNLGVMLSRQGRLDEAIAEYFKALKLNPTYAEAHGNLGVAYHDKGIMDRALEEYLIALSINPFDFKFHNNLAIVFEEKGMFDEAAREFTASIQLRPKEAKPHMNLGIVYAKKHLFNDALREFDLAMSLNPQEAEIYYNLGVTFQEIGRMDDAVKSYKKALELRPGWNLPEDNLRKILP